VAIRAYLRQRPAMSGIQPGLPGLARTEPEGLVYAPALIALDQETALVREFRRLPFKPFDFRGFQGNRRVVYFGYRYDYGESTLLTAEEIPAFLLPLRALAASFAGIEARELRQALISEYAPRAGIGWHRDRPAFNDVIGISFVSACRFRFRMKTPDGWKRTSVLLEPRSAYLLRGPVRTVWEHSIAGSDHFRYSVTFRSMLRGHERFDVCV